MVSFTTFYDRLPDPTFGLGNAGNLDNSAGTYGPGFASVSVVSNRPVQTSRTLSGRGVSYDTGQHWWEISINYNPMKRDDFDVVSSFLDARNGKLNPFFVVLPQYSKPKDPSFATFVTTNAITVSGAHLAGSQYILMQAGVPIVGTPKPGDFLTFTDSADVNHLKAYKVTRVETNGTYNSNYTQPTTAQVRVWIMPPLTRNLSTGATVNFLNPQFRVYQKTDTLEYALDTNNTWQFQLSLEEILP